MTDTPDTSGDQRIVSLKRIAQYLQCSERTARRWAAEDGLPVHRHSQAVQSSVFAYRSELDAWLRNRPAAERGANGVTTAGGSNGRDRLPEAMDLASGDGADRVESLTQDDRGGPAWTRWLSDLLPRKRPRFGLELSGWGFLAGSELRGMRASKFSDAQKAFILKQGEEGVPVAEVCRKAGISQATYFKWKKKYAGLMLSEMKRLKQLEDENARLKRIVADLSPDKEMLQDVLKRKL